MGKLAESLQEYFATTPKEQLDKVWEEIKPLNDIGPDVLESCKEWQKMIHEGMTDKRRQEYFNMREDIDIQRRLYEYIGMFDEIYDVYHTMRKWTIEDFREWLKNRAAEWETKIENNFNGKQGK